MALNILANELMINNMEKVKNFGQMAQSMKDHMKMVKSMVKDH